MKIKYLLIAILSFILCSNAFADRDNQGRRMHVQISNETGSDCILTHQQLLHGKYDTLPPQSMTKHDSKWFDVEQIVSLIGPDVQMSYTCGNNSISFEVQQTSSFLVGHTPYVTLWENRGLTIDSTGESSSIWFDYAGTIYITLRSVAAA